RLARRRARRRVMDRGVLCAVVRGRVVALVRGRLDVVVLARVVRRARARRLAPAAVVGVLVAGVLVAGMRVLLGLRGLLGRLLVLRALGPGLCLHRALVGLDGGAGLAQA